ncbi:MAG: glycosyltransferase [Acidobacteria bacterium]|nr:glycosyltransferase [Acidobacteriota bacterium]
MCIVTPEFPGPMRCGGAGTAVYWHARTLADAGIAVDVLLTADVEIGTAERWTRRLALELGITFVEAHSWMARERPDVAETRFSPGGSNLIRSQWVLEFLRARPYDVVYLQDYLGHGMAALQARAAGLDFQDTRFALTLHGPTRWALDGLEMFPSSPETLGVDHQEKTSVELADRVFAPSRYLREWAVSQWHVSRRDIDVLPYCFTDAPTRRRRVVHGPFRHLVFFGRLETRKGLENFLQAVTSSASLRRDVRQITFLGKSGTASSTSGRELIERTLGEGGAPDWQILDTKDTFQAWDWLQRQRDVLVVAPSLSDNLPYAVIELFQRRLPFITTDIGGIPEIVGDNPGVMCAPSAAALRERLENVVGVGRLAVAYDTGHDARAARKATLARHRELVADQARATKRIRSKRVVTRTSARRSRTPDVSVVVTHFNYGGYLPYALRSLANQQCNFPYEVLVVDDASSRADHRDAFLAMSREYAGDRRFRFFPETVNRGAGGARNFAAAHAKGKYLVFFDADNEALPDLLAVYRQAIETSGCDAMSCYVAIVQQDDYAAPRSIGPVKADAIYAPPGGSIEAGYFANVFGDTCAIHRRSVFERVGGFSADSPWYRRLPSGDFDWELFAKLNLAGFKVGVVPRVLFRYRSSSANQQSQNVRWHYRIRSIIRARYSTPDARRRVDWEWMLGLTEAYRSHQAVSGRSHYDHLAGLPDDQLMMLIGRRPGGQHGETIRRIRERLAPLAASWDGTKPRVFLYGAGLHTRVLLGVVPELARMVVGIIDRSAQVAFLDWPVMTPDQYRPAPRDVIVYSSKEHEEVMYAGFAHHPVEHVLIHRTPRAGVTGVSPRRTEARTAS